jgi:hypothetical protein
LHLESSMALASLQQFARAKQATSWRVAATYRTSKAYFRGISITCTA